MWNALDYPACVLPVTRVNQTLDAKQPPHPFLSDRDKIIYELCMHLSPVLPISILSYSC